MISHRRERIHNRLPSEFGNVIARATAWRTDIPLSEYLTRAFVDWRDKTGDDRWYVVNVPIADRLYDEHLQQLRKEGLING